MTDKEENFYFFIDYNDKQNLSANLMCFKDGMVHRDILLSNVEVVLEAQPEKQTLYVHPSTKTFFKLISDHNGHCLIFSHELKTLFVAENGDLDNAITEFLEASGAIPSSADDDGYKSPYSVTWIDELYSIEVLPSLFKSQPVTDELTNFRLNFIKQGLIPHLSKKKRLSDHAIRVLFESAKELFAKGPRIVSIHGEVDESFTVVGDIHGQYPDLLKIFGSRNDPSAKNKYLFNGDIVDRGRQSCACLFLLLAYKIALPDSFFINRGNHESRQCAPCTFYREMMKYDKSGELFEEAHEMFRFMPTAHILNETAFIVHGGIPENFDIAAYNGATRPASDEYDVTEVEMLWNDPCESEGFSLNESRGGGARQFGPDVTKDFLKRHHLQFIIRSHSFAMYGAKSEHDGRCYTVFSAPNYCGLKNEAAFIGIQFYHDHMKPTFYHFE